MPTRTTREPKPLSDTVIGFRSHEFRDCRVLFDIDGTLVDSN